MPSNPVPVSCLASVHGSGEPLSRLTSADVAEILEVAGAAGYPPLILTPMMLTIPPVRVAWEAFVAEHSGTTLALARRKLQERRHGR